MESTSFREPFLSQPLSRAQFTHERAEGESHVMSLRGAHGVDLALLQTRSALQGR